MVPIDSHQTLIGYLAATGKEGGDGLNDGWSEEKNIFPSKDHLHSRAHT